MSDPYFRAVRAEHDPGDKDPDPMPWKQARQSLKERAFGWRCALEGMGRLAGAAVYCTPESHERLKLDDAAWSALPVPRAGGLQEIPAGVDAEAEPAELHEVRNCDRCGSTITRWRCYVSIVDVSP